MSSLFDKLSTLVNAQVNDLLGKNPKSPLARIRLNPEEAEKDPRRSAGSLRQRLDEAVEYEADLQAKIDALMNEAADLDGLVDACLQRGDQFGARRLQGQLNMKQQQLTIAESELRDHRAVTRHLMGEMVTLDAALDERERRQRAQPAEGASRPSGNMRIPVEGAVGNAADAIVGGVTDKLNEARDNIESLMKRESPAPKPPSAGGDRGKERIVIVDEEPDPRTPKRRKTDQENMNRRLSRLSKPDDSNS